MKKFFMLIMALALTFSFAQAQKLTKDEKKKLKKELKNYEKNLESYKAKMDEIRTTLDSNDVEIKRLKDEAAMATAVQNELENKVYGYEAQIKVMQAENDSLKAPKPEVDMNITPAQGTVYKVQLGMYKILNLNKYFEEPRSIGYEAVDGMNRYVIGYFTDQKTAQNFVQDIRKFGIKDAFVSKYIDGVRVYEWNENPKYRGKKIPASLQEALENDKGKKKSGK